MGSDCLLIWDFFGGDGNVLELDNCYIAQPCD